MDKQEIKKIAERAAFVAIDQKDEFGSVEATINAYRDNLVDTLNDEGYAEWRDDALDHYDEMVKGSYKARDRGNLY